MTLSLHCFDVHNEYVVVGAVTGERPVDEVRAGPLNSMQLVVEVPTHVVDAVKL